MSRLRVRPGRYRLFKRGKYWYYWTYDEYGDRHVFSTGERRKLDAEDECERRKDLGILVYRGEPEPERRPVLLHDYGQGFWNYDTCPVIQDRIQRGGRFSLKLSKTYQGFFRNHIDPALGSKRIDAITRQDIKSFLLSLPKKGLTNKSANNVFTSLRMILGQAVDDGIVERNVAMTVKALSGKGGRRGAFTLQQVRLLFSGSWENRYAYIACYLGSRTGMRVSEIRALRTEQIHPDHIVVDASWGDEGRKCTKSGFSRIVPIERELYTLLQEIMPPRPGILFTLDGKKPLCINWFSRNLRKRMDAINGQEPDPKTGTTGMVFDYMNKKEPLSFHSFRHFLNTRMLAADLPEKKIQAIIGHESDEMTEHYAHLELEDLQIFKAVLKAI